MFHGSSIVIGSLLVGAAILYCGLIILTLSAGGLIPENCSWYPVIAAGVGILQRLIIMLIIPPTDEY